MSYIWHLWFCRRLVKRYLPLLFEEVNTGMAFCLGTTNLCYSIWPFQKGTIKGVSPACEFDYVWMGNVMFTDESRFVLKPDGKCVRVWREQRTRTMPENITHSSVKTSWSGQKFRCTYLHIYKQGSVTAQRYQNEILTQTVKLHAVAVGSLFV